MKTASMSENSLRIVVFAISITFFLTTFTTAQDPNFHIYLAFGQSNMEGNATPEAQDLTGVNARFQVLQSVPCSNLGRVKGSWYTAVSPLCRCNTGLNPGDYFGRTMTDSLPSNIRIGIINVSVAGCAIEMFDKVRYQTYIATQATWMQSIANEYGGNPYARLVEMATLAKQVGVIKGILFHQGESGSSTGQWAAEVKIVRDNLVQDLGLNPATPFLAGDLVRPSTMVQNLPRTLPNSYVVSSAGLTERGDGLHFDATGYRNFGKRYAVTMLGILRTSTGFSSGFRIAKRGEQQGVRFELQSGSLTVQSKELAGLFRLDGRNQLYRYLWAPYRSPRNVP